MPMPDEDTNATANTMMTMPPLHSLLQWVCIFSCPWPLILLCSTFLFYYLYACSWAPALWGALCHFRVVVLVLTTYVDLQDGSDWPWVGQQLVVAQTSPNWSLNWLEPQWTGCKGSGLVVCGYWIELNWLQFWFGPKMEKNRTRLDH